ncbi:sulfite exporter TauE/SafE family protein [Parapedobacter lycopersici]|uniref:sulfite exporter TauE/SafE family protein n=1 Tax=Parapedobacter lycopersici TaxID=1864939 RepID=UPI00214D971D|nr:sulfite exporter TauE/SafE family protein [Parapedobacter lycopersici]
MEFVGYLASLFIGIALGLIGGGGSILTVPVLVYLFGLPPITATAYSLFIVGATSLVGAWPKYRKGLVDLKTAVIFGIPSIITVYATRKYLVPAIPDPIFTVGGFALGKPVAVMLLFALMMLAASISMIRKKPCRDCPDDAVIQYNYPMILLEGILVGSLTGLVGAGGGFLIIPALVLLSRLSMKMAVGTSLLIIAAKSLLGFTGDVTNMPIDWGFLLLVTGLAILGFYVGNGVSARVPSHRLQKGFGWFVLLMSLYILVNELFLC